LKEQQAGLIDWQRSYSPLGEGPNYFERQNLAKNSSLISLDEGTLSEHPKGEDGDDIS